MNFWRSWEKKSVFWRTCKKRRLTGGAKEVSNVMVAEERHYFRVKQHRRLLKVVDMLQQVRTEYLDHAEICPVCQVETLAAAAARERKLH